MNSTHIKCMFEGFWWDLRTDRILFCKITKREIFCAVAFNSVMSAYQTLLVRVENTEYSWIFFIWCFVEFIQRVKCQLLMEVLPIALVISGAWRGRLHLCITASYLWVEFGAYYGPVFTGCKVVELFQFNVNINTTQNHTSKSYYFLLFCCCFVRNSAPLKPYLILLLRARQQPFRSCSRRSRGVRVSSSDPLAVYLRPG